MRRPEAESDSSGVFGVLSRSVDRSSMTTLPFIHVLFSPSPKTLFATCIFRTIEKEERERETRGGTRGHFNVLTFSLFSQVFFNVWKKKWKKNWKNRFFESFFKFFAFSYSSLETEANFRKNDRLIFPFCLSLVHLRFVGVHEAISSLGENGHH